MGEELHYHLQRVQQEQRQFEEASWSPKPIPQVFAHVHSIVRLRKLSMIENMSDLTDMESILD